MRVVRDAPPLADGVVVRPADGDHDAIAALCRRVPVAGPTGLTWVDHGAGWWRALARVPGRRVFVAEQDGAIVGVHAATPHDVRFDARVIRLVFVGPTRMDPRMQGTGAFRALRRAVVDAEPAEPYSLVPLGDAGARLPVALKRWPVRYLRWVIDCRRAAAGSGDVRCADPADAADLLRMTRAGAVLAPVDELDGIETRLRTGGRGYGRDRLLTNGDAVVGVGRSVGTVRVEGHAGVRRQATAVDIGASSATALGALLQVWCTRLAGDGVDDLVVWSHAGGIVDRAVAPLACTSTAHAIDLGLMPPPDLATRGFHLDASLL